ncbi:DUF1648 domain-containing protein [Alkalicoccobacillus plakortidis]|uniref:DUF1648 domain-containing protein n=1 Tax=Alkalicoccobacillus plakortidis TaxID=444060 RepID=A0ABT0XLJ7_9BACI|nr:DUF1648 domain-containing protein [Alkalicoccobacillus plakortidis]MCM2676605.1 DUF1648 domain-containing protein [Alkalicoccobacillus plakortidis]
MMGKLMLSLGFIVFVIHVGYLIYFWPTLPAEIAIQYNHLNEATQWGSKALLLLMPGGAIVLWLVIHLITRKPENLNYINLTEANKHLMYEKGRTLSIVLKNCSFMMLILANQAFLLAALNQSTVMALTLAGAMLTVTLIYPVYVLFWSILLKAED